MAGMRPFFTAGQSQRIALVAHFAYLLAHTAMAFNVRRRKLA